MNSIGNCGEKTSSVTGLDEREREFVAVICMEMSVSHLKLRNAMIKIYVIYSGLTPYWTLC